MKGEFWRCNQKNPDNDIEMLQMTRHKFSNLFHKGTQTKSQVPATHQLILENLLQVPAPHHFLIINLLSPLEKNIYQSERFNHFRGAKRDKLLGKEKE